MARKLRSRIRIRIKIRTKIWGLEFLLSLREAILDLPEPFGGIFG